MPMRNMSKTDSGCGASCAATSPETIAAGVGRDGSYVVTDAPRATGRRSMGTIVQQPPGGLPVVARQISGVAADPPDLRPPRGLLVLGVAALCARGRRPAREIATRELRSEWSISRPALALPPPMGAAATPYCPAGPAAAFLLVVLVAPLVFRAPEGPAAREARRPHFVRRRASKPARALRSLRRPPHRRRLWFWCEWPGPAAGSNRACVCACYGPAAAFRVGVCGECGRIRIGCRYPDRLCASG